MPKAKNSKPSNVNKPAQKPTKKSNKNTTKPIKKEPPVKYIWD